MFTNAQKHFAGRSVGVWIRQTLVGQGSTGMKVIVRVATDTTVAPGSTWPATQRIQNLRPPWVDIRFR